MGVDALNSLNASPPVVRRITWSHVLIRVNLNSTEMCKIISCTPYPCNSLKLSFCIMPTNASHICFKIQNQASLLPQFTKAADVYII